MKTGTTLVEVPVIVRDSQGRPIGGLGKDDFEIEDAGKKRLITAFSIETSTPAGAPAQPSAAYKAGAAPETATAQLRFVALLFDDYSMNFAEQVSVKAAARRFIREGLAKDDRVGLFTTSGRQIVPFTADAAKLLAAIDRHNSRPRIPDGGICPKLTSYDAYLIANKIDLEAFKLKLAERGKCFSGRRGDIRPQDIERIRSFGDVPMNNELMVQAVTMWSQVRDTSMRALDTMGKLVDYMGQLSGRRMILLASSGFLVRTLEAEHQKVVDHALRAEIVINALDGKGLYTEDPPEVVPGADERSLMRMVQLAGQEKDLGNDIMSILARSTGGLFFENNNDLDLGFRKLGMVPEVSYLLGFSPEGAPNGKYHELKVRMKSRNQYLIQARPGYWAVPKQQETPVRERRADRMVMSSDLLSELPVFVAPEPSKTEIGDTALDVVLQLDIRSFHFLEKDGVRAQNLVFIAALFDDRGNFVAGKEADIKFALQESTYKRLTESGLDMSVTLQAPPGNYRLRAVAQDAIDGKISATTLPVEIR